MNQTRTRPEDRSYYTVQMMQDEQFLQFPKWLMLDPAFAHLSNDAKVLYTFLKDRFRLSSKNRWFDRDGRVFVVCKRESMMETLNKSKNTVTKIMGELKRYGLLEEKINGNTKPNYIYLLMPLLSNTTVPDFDEDRWMNPDYGDVNPKKRESKSSDIGIQESQILGANKNDISKSNYNNSSINNNSKSICTERDSKEIDSVVEKNSFTSFEDFSDYINEDILTYSDCSDAEMEALKFKNQIDYELFQKYKNSSNDIALLIRKLSLPLFRIVLSFWPRKTDNVKRTEDLILSCLTNRKYMHRTVDIASLNDKQMQQLSYIAEELYEPERAPTIYKSRKAYLLGVIDNIL